MMYLANYTSIIPDRNQTFRDPIPGPCYSTSIDMGIFRMDQLGALLCVVRYASIIVILSIIEIVCIDCASTYKIAAPIR
jgi:hypothetical protein